MMQHIKKPVRPTETYSAVDYTLSAQESARWDRGDDTDRRTILGRIGERLAASNGAQGGCAFRFYHSDGHLVGKCIHHAPLFEEEIA
jgi:hypothetical protein